MGIGAAIGGAGIAGALAQVFGASTAASAQTKLGEKAISAEQGMFGTAQAALNPYIQGGQKSLNTLVGALPQLTAPYAPTLSNLEQFPGYQFAKDAGLEATQNSMAGQGLGRSGNALVGGANYSEGLASTTFQQGFQDYWANQQAKINAYLAPSQLGVGAAGALASAATTTGGQIGSAYQGIGQAQAGAATLGGSAVAGGLNTAAGGYTLAQLLPLLNNAAAANGAGNINNLTGVATPLA